MDTNPINARGFHTHGKEFFYAAEAVRRSANPPTLPLAFLWGRTVELLLKSYLMNRGVPVEVLRSKKFGHNLASLYREATDKGISKLIGSDGTFKGLVDILNIDYGTKRFEYRETGARYFIPDQDGIRRLIRRLLKGIDLHLNENGI